MAVRLAPAPAVRSGPRRDGAGRGAGGRAGARYNPPMPRVREIEEPSDDPLLKDLYERDRQLFGFVLNTTKVQAHCPPILKAAKQLSAAMEKSGRLPAGLLSLVYLRVAQINGCPF